MTMSSSTATKTVSFTDPDVQRCPFHAYASLRQLGPVYKEPDTGFYVILDYNLCRQVAADNKTFKNNTGLMRGRQREEVVKLFQESGVIPTEGLVTGDGADHQFQRALVEKVFTMARVKKMEPYLTKIVDECIDSFIDDGTADFVRDLAVRVPVSVIADQVGVPRDDIERFKYWSDCAAEYTNPDLKPERELELTKIEIEFNNYILEKAENYRESPADVLLSDIVHAEIDGRKVSDGELVAMVSLLIIAGNETTTNAMGSAMNRLIEEPELQSTLRGDPTKVEAFVEEVLRHTAPIQGLFRRAEEDSNIGGVSIPAGSFVVLRWGAANRDPQIYEDPDTFDVARPKGKTHLTFGYGRHFCLGSHLARSELRIAIERILARTRNIRAAAKSGVSEPFATYVNYGYAKQLIAFDRP